MKRYIIPSIGDKQALHYLNPNKREQIFMDITKKIFDTRIDPRITYIGHIFFTTKSGFFEGELTNYSRHGLFIKTQEDLTLGEIITVALPHEENNQTKFQAQILWRNNEGYGLELLRKRNDISFQIRKIEAKSR
jgi:hypothetical protein